MKQTRTWTALITPLNEDNRVDFKELKQLLDSQEEVGNGIVLLGSTGENLAFSLKEKREILQFVSENKGTYPLIVGVGGYQLQETLQWISYCESYNIDGYLLVTPIYSRPGPKGQEQWFRTLLDHVTLPCMLYNVPHRAGCELSIEAVQKLLGHPNFWALKEASGTIQTFCEYRNALPGIVLFSGCDDLYPEVAKEGAYGLVSVMSNVWPKSTKYYVEGDFNAVPQEAIHCVNYRNPVSLKALMHETKILKTPNVRAPLSVEDAGSIDVLLHNHNQVLDRESVGNPC